MAAPSMMTPSAKAAAMMLRRKLTSHSPTALAYTAENVPTIENRNEPAARLRSRLSGSTSSETHERNKVAVRLASARYDVKDSISILIALARLYPNACWHQLLLWFFNRLREKPLEVSHGARLLLRLFRRIS
jgi:hypothetical protein